MRRSARSYTRRYGRRVSSRLVGYWNSPRPILKYSYKQSINVGDEWEFGWGHFDTDYYQLDFNSEILFNDASSLPKYLALQYGRWIINKVVIVLDSYDISRFVSNTTKPKANEYGAVLPDPIFDKSRLYWEMYFPNNRDSFGTPVLGDRYEFVKRVKMGRKFKHTYYPRCKKTIKTVTSEMHAKLGDILTKMGSPDGGRSIGYVGFGPLTNLPVKTDSDDYVKYSISMSWNYYVYMTFTDRNIQMMI